MKSAKLKTIILVITLLTLSTVIASYFLGFFYITHIDNQYNGEYWIVGVKNNAQAPYKYFECQHSNRYFFLRCSGGRVLRSGTLKGFTPN